MTSRSEITAAILRALRKRLEAGELKNAEVLQAHCDRLSARLAIEIAAETRSRQQRALARDLGRKHP